MNHQVCVDASFALKLVLDEPESGQVFEQWSHWIAAEIEIVAPYHLIFEAVSVIRNHVYRKNISAELGELAFGAFLAQGIRLFPPDQLHQRAWGFAVRFNRPTAYDAYYLALGDHLGCEVWTADRRLHSAVGSSLQWLKFLG
jgi:predicted nucleic acid-binding protein